MVYSYDFFFKMMADTKIFFVPLISTLLLLCLTFELSAAHWLCDGLPCPTLTSDVYGRGTLEFNCFPNYEDYSASMLRCSSYCSLKECAMISYDNSTSVCYILGIGLGPLLATATFIKDHSSFSGSHYNVALNKPVSYSSNDILADDFDTRALTATDGESSNDLHFFHSVKETDPFPWLQIDLGKNYAIHGVRFLPRTNNFVGYYRATKITMFIGTNYVSTGDFSSYEQVWYYEGPYGVEGAGGTHWLEETFSTIKCGRYFAISKGEDTTYDDNVLEVTEIEVLSSFE